MCVVYIPVHMGLSIPTVGDTENLSVNLVFLETTPSQHLLISPSIFGVWGHMRLYVRLRDTPDATSPFLVDIKPSRVVLSAILVPRDPCDNSEMCVRAWSLPVVVVRRLLTQTVF